ncbi:MAG: recombinase RmuC [Candidatus Marinimicrobia bacterium]|nr:recombinase RmuC [Candidatus Neomarinimicrobiota bacterium]|tara:strand:- start:1100 stop:2302 length:1203 start_codon:yes stop_codon:yes gene_type:complete
MIESIFIIIALLIGIAVGWILKKNSIPVISDNSNEIKNLNERLLASEKRESVANTKVDEIKKRFEEEKNRIEKVQLVMGDTFKALASDIAKGNSEEFLKMAGDKFNSLKESSEKQLDEKKKLIDQNLEGMNLKLENISKQSTELKISLEKNKSETEKLRDTTGKLREILSSSQKRGQWGERMVEDILQFVGLVEHINYKKQVIVESGEKPDYTFFLPKEKVLNMDVKFPLDHYERFIDSNNDFEMETEKNAFLKDVKNHIKSVASRTYIDTTSGTLDYVMLFIPNESIYGFINKENPDLINFALENRVLLCSPLTLYAVLSLIHQATRNFAMEEQAEEVLKLLEAFRIQWEKYVEKMETLGRSIESTKKNYDQLTSTRTNQLQKTLKNIEFLNQSKSSIK